MPSAEVSSEIEHRAGSGPHVALAERISRAATLLELVDHAAEQHGQKQIGFGATGTLTIGELMELATRAAHALFTRELPEGSVIALALPTGPEIMPVFLGAMYAGLVPTITPTPGLVTREEFAERIRQVVDDAHVRVVVTLGAWRSRIQAALDGRLSSTVVLEPRELLESSRRHRVTRRPSDIAFLQYSSGSTSQPKGIVLTHANVVAGIAAIVEAGENSSDDVVLQWLPLYHDMGLLNLLTSIASGASHHLTDPMAPFRDPAAWLSLLGSHKVSYFGGSCTTLGYLADTIDDSALRELDFRSVRLVCVGAEPIDPDVIGRFERRFARAGLRPNVVAPAYGMAEATLGIAAHKPADPMRVDSVDRERLGRERRVRRIDPGDPRARRVVSLGRPLRGIALRIVSPDSGATLPEDIEGEVEIRGAAVMHHYLNHPPSDSHRGAWLRTGDLGYVAGGHVFLTGRLKQMVIVNGVNYHAEDCEWALAGIEQVFRGRCAAIDTGAGDLLTIIVETREDAAGKRRELAHAVHDRIRSQIGLHRVRVALARPRTIPHTTSGKPRRVALRDMLLEGRLRPHALEYFDDVTLA